ncbi:hypothetical protein [Oricola sp.]|uniref:hypothetical protein n=1 Tax=Oricola sp. TaxID=1979950 RepID=UPI003BA8FAF0
MRQLGLQDWVALYAALLSTVLALVGLYRWLRSGPRLSVTVFHPLHSGYRNSEKIFLSVISNIGSSSAVVERVHIEFLTSKRFWAQKVGEAVFDDSTRWKPAVKLIPVEGRPSSSREELNVLKPNDEIRAPADAIKGYDPKKHWIKVTAIPRRCGKKFVGWAAPIEVND